jgi:hypothetical protein
MTTFESAGFAALQLHEAERRLAHRIAAACRSLLRRGPADDALSGVTFAQLEPDLATETGRPGIDRRA